MTIVIPTVNRLGLFRKALASALAQTVPVEIIVSDNGSSDGTEVVLPSLDLPANVRRFRHAPTMPVQDHGWFLISQVRTEWTVFLSDDDFLEPGFAAGVVELIDEKPDVAFVYTGCDLFYADVAVPGHVGPRFENAPDFLFNFMDGKRNISMCATAFLTQGLRDAGRQPDNVLIGDMYYWTKALESGGVVGCDDRHLSNYFFYRPGMTSETSRNNVINWARESREVATRMRSLILADPRNTHDKASVDRLATKFLSLTVSNQFAWNALRGAGKGTLIRSFFRLAWIILRNVHAIVRVGGVIVLPRSVVEDRVLAHARRQARDAGRLT